MILDRKDSEAKAASILGDVRSLIQDFLAPELREIKARQNSLEKRMDDRFEAVEKRMDDRFETVAHNFAGVHKRIDEIEQRNMERHAEILEAIRENDKRMERRVETILDFTAMREKVAVLEAERQARQRATS